VTYDMPVFDEIDNARKLLGIAEFASLKEIKQAYRKKAFSYHPDKAERQDAESEEMMKNINQAYKLLVEYCSRFKFSFREEDVDRAYPDEAYTRKYVYGWFDGM